MSSSTDKPNDAPRPSSESDEHYATRFRRLVLTSDDLLTIVLKGHLLIEEQVLQLRDRSVLAPEYLKPCRIQSDLNIRLTMALTGAAKGDRLWDFVLGLNKLRNKLAHHAEYPDMEKRVDCLLRRWSDKPIAEANRATELVDVLAFVFVCIHHGMDESSA